MKMLKNKYIIFIILSFVFFITCTSNIYGQEVDNQNNVILEEISQNVNIDGYISSLQEYINDNNIEGIEISEITDSLMSNGSINYKNLFIKILNIFSKDIVKALTGAISIFIIIVIMSLISSLELEEKSDVSKLAHLVCYLAIVVIMFSTFMDVISSFKSIISSLTTIMQVISPFLMGVIMATGKITSIGVIKPMLLFIASAIGFLINYIVVPFICISVSLNIISNISENLNLNKLSKLFNTSSIWVVSVTLTIFLGVLSLETTLTSSVDSLAIKATQTAVSNFVPVVGKFFSDSFETVIGATHIIANVGGIIGIIVIFVISIIPILKIFSIMLIYTLLASLAEPICEESQITKFILGFASTYKTLLGILIGIAILFIISTGIILNLASGVTS